MGRSRRNPNRVRSQTLPSSPSHSFSSSSSSSDFEFRVSISPRKNSSTHLCPADELFYKGQLLPLQLSPRLSMVRTLLLSSSSTSSSSHTTTNSSSAASRDSSGSSSSSDVVLFADYNCDSSRPSSVTEDEEIKRLNLNGTPHQQIKKKYHFSLPKFSSVFKKGPAVGARIDSDATTSASGSSVKRMSTSAKEVIRKYVKKVRPLYEKFSQKQKMHAASAATNSSTTTSFLFPGKFDRSRKDLETYTRILNKENASNCSSNSSGSSVISHSFSGNLRYPRRRSCVSSCPSSMRSSPSHSGVLSKTGLPSSSRVNGYSDSSSMEELQGAIQGAIAHCKNSMVQNNKSLISNEI